MKKRLGLLFISFLIIAVILLGTLFIAPGLVPTDTYRDKLEGKLSQTLGRDVKIAGDIKISTFPMVKVQTGPLSLANPKGFTEDNFVDVKGMSANVKLWPLLRKQVEISSVTLESPSINLKKRADGAVNWAISDNPDAAQQQTEASPFRRDGRYTSYDPSLSLLQVSDGTLLFIDEPTGKKIKAEAVNFSLRAPSLSKPLSLNGDLIIDGMATNLEATLNSPLDFLSGKKTGFEASTKTSDGTFEMSGTFNEGEEVSFDASFETDITSPLNLAKRLPLPETLIIPELSEIISSGKISHSPNSTRFPKIDLAAKGPGLSVNYSGTLEASDGVAASGDFAASLNDISIIEPYMKDTTDALSLMETVDLKGTLDWNGTRLSLPAVDGKIEGTDLSASFVGSGRFEDALTLKGNFDVRSNDVSALTPLMNQPVDALNAIKTIDAKGALDWTENGINVSELVSSVSGPQITASFNGSGGFNESLALTGSFDGETPNLDSFLKDAGIVQTDAAALRRVVTSGDISLSNSTKIKLSNFTATASEGLLNGKYDGELGFDETLNLTGKVSGDIPDLGALNAAIPREIPYAAIAKRVSLSSQITNQGSGFALSDLTAALDDGLLIGDFNGRLTTGNQSNISGSLNVSAASLRAIAQSENIDLPPPTDVGPIFEMLQIAGQVGGTPSQISFNDGTLSLDALSGSGDFILDLSEAKPKLSGGLTLGEMDLRPYMAAYSDQNPTGQIMPWAKTPINLSGLNAINAQIDLTVPALLTDRIQLGQTDTKVRIQNGILTTDINKTALYGGHADGTFTLGSTNEIPTLSFETNIKSVDALNFLKATSGFEKVTGTADLTLSINASGQSQDAIMKSLSGAGTFDVINGQLLGIEASNLLSGIDQALVSKSLPLGAASGIGGSTDFDDLDGNFSVSQGRATVEKFQLQSRALFIDAEGVIDIGGQTLDFRMRPMLSEGSNVAQFGIPIRFIGKFGQAKPSLDSDFLGQIIEDRARQAARNVVTDRVGGALGSFLGGAIGGSANIPEPSETETSAPEPNSDSELNPPAQAPAVETPDESPPPPQDLEDEIEHQIEGALKGLFGKKKTTNDAE